MRESVGRLPRYCFCVVLVALFGVSLSARAATKTWTGAGVGNLWSTAANWSPPGAPSPGDDLVFPAGALQLGNNNDTAPGTSYHSIAFTGPVGGYLLIGNAIQLVAGIASNNSLYNYIQFGVTLVAPQTFSAAGVGLAINAPLDLGIHTLTVSTALGGVVAFMGGVSGSGGLTGTGSGALNIVSACTYTGPTVITGGYLFMAGYSLSPASAVSIGAGAAIQIAGGASLGPLTVSPGAVLVVGAGGAVSQIGNVTDLTLQPGSIAGFLLFSAADYGRLNVSGTATVSGSLLSVGLGYTPTPGDAFTLINKTSGGAVTGTFSDLPEGGVMTSVGRLYRITYAGGDGNDVVLTDLGPAPPAPSAVPALGGTGLALLGALLAVSAVFVLRRSG